MTNREAVRLAITDQAGTIFTDAEIDYFLSAEGDVVDMAAARALDVMAVSAAKLAKAESSGQFSQNRQSIPDALMKMAARLRDGVLGDSAAPAFSTAEIRYFPNEDDV